MEEASLFLLAHSPNMCVRAALNGDTKVCISLEVTLNEVTLQLMKRTMLHPRKNDCELCRITITSRALISSRKVSRPRTTTTALEILITNISV